jgi:hypothetical protein
MQRVVLNKHPRQAHRYPFNYACIRTPVLYIVTHITLVLFSTCMQSGCHKKGYSCGDRYISQRRGSCVGGNRYLCYTCEDFDCQDCGALDASQWHGTDTSGGDSSPRVDQNTPSVVRTLQCLPGYFSTAPVIVTCLFDGGQSAGYSPQWKPNGNCGQVPNQACSTSFANGVFSNPPVR